jgi:hypothetical protein
MSLTIYHDALQHRFASLHPVLHRIFGAEGEWRALGRLTVRRSTGWLRSLAARLLGLPPAGEYDLVLLVTLHKTGQCWERRIGPYVVTTMQSVRSGLLAEASGPGCLGYELTPDNGALIFHPRRAWLLGVPWPRWLAPMVESKNYPLPSGGWRVQVRFRMPLLGPVAEYGGDVIVEERKVNA